MRKIGMLWLGIGLLGLAVTARDGGICVLETERGTLTFRMFPEVAPLTVARISELADSGFFDGLVFHRVVADFVVQSGDPTGTGEGGSGRAIPAEFSQLHYIRGSVGMARSDDVNSNDSQFFICITDQPHLDGRYTLFGQVILGEEVLDRIRQGDKILRMRTKQE